MLRCRKCSEADGIGSAKSRSACGHVMAYDLSPAIGRRVVVWSDRGDGSHDKLVGTPAKIDSEAGRITLQKVGAWMSGEREIFIDWETISMLEVVR